jgi:triacylglycerol lipase
MFVFLASIFVICLFPNLALRIIQWTRALTLDLFFLLLLVPMRLASFFSSDRPLSPKEPRRPILLVHGYLDGGFVWWFLKRALAKKGFGPIYTINLGYPFASIDSFSKRVQKKAEEISSETRRSDLVLIGHSMGGIVSTYYALQAPQKDNLHIITLGSPLKGTHLAKLGPGQCAREMEIGSNLLQRIQEAKHSPFLYHIATSTDQLVIPYSSALLVSDPSRTHLFHDLGHIALLFSPRAAEKICEWLSQID